MSALLVGMAVAAAAAAGATASAEFPGARRLAALEARYAPFDVRLDLGALPAGERRALAKLVEAARLMDALFLRQAWAGNPALLAELAADSTALGRARLSYFLRNKGPWDRLDADRPFLPGVGEKPPGANFYPADATKAEVESWLSGLGEAERERAGGFFTVVRRDPGGRLEAVPYSLEYQGELAEAARLLREAAAATGNATLRRFLEARAQAFLSNDYRPSDLAWMELDAEVEPTIGPYETYEDGWFNAKAAFEAFIAVRDAEETRKLSRYAGELQDIEDHLPIDDRYKNPKLGALAPIRVVNEVFAAGDAAHGVTTAAYNLPNDEAVVREKGSKRVMLRNVQEAKFRVCVLPISAAALAESDRRRVGFDAYFAAILAHELMHGLGPHRIEVGGRATTVRQALEEVYSPLEEAKADVSAILALRRLADRGVVDGAVRRTLYPTYLAGLFRGIRFGLHEAHARGVALQLNWMLDRGAVVPRADGTFAVDEGKAPAAVESLTREIMTLQATGDRAGATALLDRLAVIRPEVKHVLDRMVRIPVDIAPRFATADELARR